MDKRDRAIIFLIVFLALGIGILYLKFVPAFPLTGDAVEYDLIAQNLVQGRGYSFEANVPTSERAPGYPYFLALIYLIFGHNFDAVRIIQFLLLAGIAAIAYLIARKNLGLPFWGAGLAALAVIVWPYFIIYSGLILTEIIFTFLLVLSAWFLIRFQKMKTYRSGAVSGIILGLAMLIKPEIMLLPLWLGFFLLLLWRSERKVWEWKKIAVFLILIAAVLTPWTVRNFIEFGAFVPIRSGLETSLGRAFITYDYTQNSSVINPDELNLGTMVLARLKNIYLFWNPGAEGERAQTLLEKYPSVNYLIWGYKIIFLVLTALAFLSFRFIKRKEVLLLWLVIGYFWVLHIILYPYPRYTLPLMPLVIILALLILNPRTQKSS